MCIATGNCLRIMAIVIAFSCIRTEQAVKTWKYDVDIFNPNNWVGERPAENCRGLIFPENYGVTTFVKNLYAEEIILPAEGTIVILDGGFIELNSNPKCIKLKEMKYHMLQDPDSWDYGDNKAVPMKERLPCDEDRIVFPKGLNSAIGSVGTPLIVKSVEYDKLNITPDIFNNILKIGVDNDYVIMQDASQFVMENPWECVLKSGCKCHKIFDVQPYINEERITQVECRQPIDVIGNFDLSCGATIVFKPDTEFDLEEFKKIISKSETIDMYASKVNDDKIQVVFAEKGPYTAESVEFAQNFYNTITKDLKFYKITKVKLQTSGLPLAEDGLSHPLTAAFISLFCALAIFGALFVIYYGPLKDLNIPQRFAVGPMTGLTTSIFARYDRNNEEGLILEEESVAGSILNLTRSFDNPLYGAASTSSRSDSTDTITTLAEQKSESAHENPLYGVEESVSSTTEQAEE